METDLLVQSIVELAETVKELVRIIQGFQNSANLPEGTKFRLEKVYEKASRAKNRAEDTL